jgi:hypothetical protein
LQGTAEAARRRRLAAGFDDCHEGFKVLHRAAS